MLPATKTRLPNRTSLHTHPLAISKGDLACLMISPPHAVKTSSLGQPQYSGFWNFSGNFKTRSALAVPALYPSPYPSPFSWARLALLDESATINQSSSPSGVVHQYRCKWVL